ncbi:MAG: phage late control D family protein [Oscillospiraceae bacterium]|nr:phage late control D family protein [Oscillospiraceae bacterium]
MDQGTYDYLSLSKKYDNFTAPGFEVYVDGKKLADGRFHVPGAEIELRADGTAGGCTFTVEGQYDFENSKWINEAANLIKPGAKLSIKGGYQERKELFYGYVDEYRVEFKSDGAPLIAVNGLDALGYLMNMCEPFYAGQKKPKQVVETMLKKSQSAGYAKKVTVGQLDGFETPVIKEQTDDWTFLRMMAQRYGATLFVVDGEIVFDTVTAKTAPILTLTIGKSVSRFIKRVSLAHQVGKVEVIGRDINEKAVQGAASSVTVGGSGKTAAQWVSGLKEAVLREHSEYVRTQKECETLAQHRLNGIAMGFVSGEGECIGIPELIPGRYIKIEGGDKKTNGAYFLTKVCHRFTSEEYLTTFEFKGAKTT